MVVVRVISLLESPRRADMAVQLDAVTGLDWAFFDAATGTPAGLPHDAHTTRRAIGRDLTAGELGCFASHFGLWRWLATAPSATVLIVLEDDLIIDPGFFAALGAAVCDIPDIGYLRLHAKAPAAATVIGRWAGRHLVRYRGCAFGTQAYLLRPPAAQRLVAGIAVVDRPIDDALDRFWSHGVSSLGVFPFPVLERAGPSTIEAARRALPPPAWRRPGVVAHRIAEAVRRRAANMRLALAPRR